MMERHAERTEAELKAEENRRQRAREFLADTNERARLAEYRRAGVEPPTGMRCSLSFLRSLGWTIEEINGKPTLMKPKETAA